MGLTSQHEQMNRALDEQLTGPARARLQTMLDTHPDESVLYEQLRKVDALFRHPPMVAAPPDFARQVMASIQAGKHEVYAPRRRLRLYWGLGLLGMLASIPLGVILLLVVVPAVVEPQALASLFQGLIQILATISGVMEGLLLFLGNLLAAYPMAPALVLTVIPLLMVWGWLVWFLQQQNRPATIVIPVQTVRSGS
jgi:hypothetical protein